MQIERVTVGPGPHSALETDLFYLSERLTKWSLTLGGIFIFSLSFIVLLDSPNHVHKLMHTCVWWREGSRYISLFKSKHFVLRAAYTLKCMLFWIAKLDQMLGWPRYFNFSWDQCPFQVYSITLDLARWILLLWQWLQSRFSVLAEWE